MTDKTENRFRDRGVAGECAVCGKLMAGAGYSVVREVTADEILDRMKCPVCDAFTMLYYRELTEKERNQLLFNWIMEHKEEQRNG